jgi:G3E family GTPase
MNSKTDPVSVIVICGLPRSGKTTLIDRVRVQMPGRRIALIREESAIAMELVARVSEAAAGGAEHVLIELPAAEDPALLATLLAVHEHSGGPAAPRLHSIVTVVDASTMLRDFSSRDLLVDRVPAAANDARAWVDALTAQIELADLIVLNRLEREEVSHRRAVHCLLTALNPGAERIESESAAVPADEVILRRRFDLQRAYSNPAWRRVLAGEEIPGATEQGISAFVYRARRPFHPQRLMSFLSEPWPGVIRVRGTLWLATRMDWKGELSRTGPARRYRGISAWWASLLEGRVVDPRQAEEFTGIPWDPLFGDRRQELAFVGIGMNEQSLRQGLDSCLLDGEEMRQGREVWRTYHDPFPRWEVAVITPDAASYH